MVFVTSDLHFCHDREFVWGARGYANVDEMNEAQVRKWNEVVTDEDVQAESEAQINTLTFYVSQR